MKTAFLYAGQGSQKTGMGKDIYDEFLEYRKIIDSVQLDFDIKSVMHEGTQEILSQTQYTQPCMAAFAAGVTDVLRANGIIPDMAAGLSLGEYSALYAAGVFDSDTLVQLVAFRGREMEKAARGIDCKMTAVLGLDRESLKDACIKSSFFGVVDIANYNCPGQYVIGGNSQAVEKAEKLALAKGARKCIVLNVSGPFHTELMKPAGDALHKKFKEIKFNELELPVVFNTTADFLKTGETIPQLLEKQVQSSVYFEDSIRRLIEEGIDTFVEIGPGKVLSGFVKKVNRNVKIYNIESADDLKAIIEKAEDFKNYE